MKKSSIVISEYNKSLQQLDSSQCYGETRLSSTHKDGKTEMDKRLIAPAIFGTLAILFGAAYASVFLILPIPLFFKLMVAAGILTVAGAMVHVIIQRKRELKEEDKDDR